MITDTALIIGPWTLDPVSGELSKGGLRRRLEPKTLGLLLLLAGAPARVFSRDEIFAAVWPGVTVADDTLARAVSKLRKALDDDPKAPRYIETLPKRGYRLITPPPDAVAMAPKRRWPVWAGLVVAGLVAGGAGLAVLANRTAQVPATNEMIVRADDFYFQYTPQDNEAAIALYERVIAADPENAQAMAGLANALVQRVMRWPLDAADSDGELLSLGASLASGRLARAPVVAQLSGARGLAEAAVRLAPGDAATHKALGLVVSAQGELDRALEIYAQALALDPAAWGALINVGDVLELSGRAEEALPYFERAYAAMDQEYAAQSARIRPWQANLGVAIAERYARRGDLPQAEQWFRDVLVLSPLDGAATSGLARLLTATGETDEAETLCRELALRTGGSVRCEDQPGPI